MRKEEEKLLKKEKKNNRYRSIKGSSITRENNLRIFATGIRYRVNHAILPLKDISSFHFFFFFFSFFHFSISIYASTMILIRKKQQEDDLVRLRFT